MSPSGLFYWVPNFSDNNIQSYSVNVATGALTSLGVTTSSGSGPTSVAVDPTGSFVYVTDQFSGDVSAYLGAAGLLVANGSPATGAPHNPVLGGGSQRQVPLHVEFHPLWYRHGLQHRRHGNADSHRHGIRRQPSRFSGDHAQGSRLSAGPGFLEKPSRGLARHHSDHRGNGLH